MAKNIQTKPATEDKPGEPLVNEKDNLQGDNPGEEADGQQADPPHYDILAQQLEDSREEVRRQNKNIETLRDHNKSLEDRIRTQATQGVATKPQPATMPAGLVADNGYDGPSLEGIYLALITGMNLRDLTNDTLVASAAKNVLGVAEVFYAHALKRPSFQLPETGRAY